MKQTNRDLSDLRNLVNSWELHLRASRKSPKTIEAYREAANQLAAFLAERGMPTTVAAIRREHVEAFTTYLLGVRSPATANNRYRALQQFFKWLVEDDEIEASPMARMKPPPLDQREVPLVSEDDLRKLIKACQGPTFEDRRDLALILFLLDTGARLSEAANLKVDHLDLKELGVALVLGKGRRERSLPMGPTTLKAVDRYLRIRARRSQSDTPWLWLGGKGRFTNSGIQQMLKRRSRQAGIGEIHPHQLRHSFAHAFLSAGGQETDLMRLAGWRSRTMVSRYASTAADERARDAHAKFSPVERL